MPLDQRNAYCNLILLCRNHHKIIDDNENGARDYPADRLQQMKKAHEEWVRNQLIFDAARQADEEAYAQIVDGWERLCHVDDWLYWSERILSYDQPSMPNELSEDLLEARRWLLTRVWPGRYERLEKAFKSFRRVLEDFHNKFLSKAYDQGGFLYTRKFYQINEWDEERYHSLLAQYEYHVDLVMDLMLELSRGANLVCDLVRHHILAGYRRDAGRLMVRSGPDYRLKFSEFVVQYSPHERAQEILYGGMEAFITDRFGRDRCFGEDPNPLSPIEKAQKNRPPTEI